SFVPSTCSSRPIRVTGFPVTRAPTNPLHCKRESRTARSGGVAAPSSCSTWSPRRRSPTGTSSRSRSTRIGSRRPSTPSFVTEVYHSAMLYDPREVRQHVEQFVENGYRVELCWPDTKVIVRKDWPNLDAESLPDLLRELGRRRWNYGVVLGEDLVDVEKDG